MTVVRRVAPRRTGTNPLVAAIVVAGARLAGVDGVDCATQPGRRRGRSQTPPAAAIREDRGRTCTTALRHERASRLELHAQRRLDRESARSSGQTVAALGTTSLENGTPTTGAHPGAETVLLGTLQIVRLKGALQRRPPQASSHMAGRIKRTGAARHSGATPELLKATGSSPTLATSPELGRNRVIRCSVRHVSACRRQRPRR